MTDNRLSKDEILRGYDSFKSVYKKSRVIEARYLKCNIQFNNENTSPQITMVGFTVSKKKIKKAYLRNRIKRLQREAFRNEKSKLTLEKNCILIFNINDKDNLSAEHLCRNGFRLFSEDMAVIFDKINNEISKR